MAEMNMMGWGVGVVIMFRHIRVTRPLTGPLLVPNNLYRTQNLSTLSMKDSMIMTFLDYKTKRGKYEPPFL